MQIVILGGGSAGWLTAGIIAADYQGDQSVAVHLVESPDIETIGVGEGTWPTMRTTLERIGLSESEFLRYCHASFKQGSQFVGWVNGSADDVYFHPFTAPNTELPAGAWNSGDRQQNYSLAVSSQPRVSMKGLAPKQKGTPEYAGVLNYGYHLDAGKFGQLLQKHCTEKLGVRHTLDTVEEVLADESGNIGALKTSSNGLVQGDLFIDCSGIGSRLIGEHFQVPFEGCAQFSVNDRAIAIQAPYAEGQQRIESNTIATAHEAGWTWDIGLSSRRGVGYVYSSAHASDDQAEATLRDYLASSVDKNMLAELPVKKLKINPGHRKKFWVNNCVAVGMAAGFIEPLEASALALIELSANMIRDELPRGSSAMAIVAERFNQIFSYRWQRIIEFLKLHYVLSERRDTNYWQDATSTNSCPMSLLEKMELWRQRPPNRYDFLQTEELFPAISYEYVLYGMGWQGAFYPTAKNLQAKEWAASYFRQVACDSERLMAHLPSNRQLLSWLAENNFGKI